MSPRESRSGAPPRRRPSDRRLELVWPGKYAPDGRPIEPDRTVAPIVAVERFPGPDGTAPSLLVAGDNLRALPALLAAHGGAVALVYADPPFLTGDEFRMARRAAGRGQGRAGRETRDSGISAHDDELARGADGGVSAPAGPRGLVAKPGDLAYLDRRPDGLAGFVAMLAPRLALLRELLRPGGALYLHLDARTVHVAKLVCDEVFGEVAFRNHLVWVYGGRELARRRYNPKHDDLLYYVNGRGQVFHPERIPEPLLESSRRAMSRHVDDDGRAYVIRNRRGGGFMAREEAGRTYRQYVPEGGLPRDWFAVDYARKSERTGYPTQKPAAVLERLLLASTEPGDLVVDPFVGSGTTAAVAAALGRRWITVDDSQVAIATTRRRLLGTQGCGGGFTVSTLPGAAPGAGSLPLAAERTTGEDGRAEIRLAGPAAALAQVGAWAVGQREEAAGGPVFVALTAAARDPWSGHLEASLSVAAGPPPQPIVARAWEQSGATTEFAIRSSDD